MAPRRDPRFAAGDVRLGYVSGMHGTRGELKLFLYNPASELLGETMDLVLVGPEGQREAVAVHLRAGAGKRILGRIEGLDDREEARDRKGWELVVHESALPQPGPFEWYHRDLLGLPVRTAAGRPLGRIAEIHATGEVDVWMLRGEGPERCLPALRRHLLSVRTRAEAGEAAEVVVADDAVDLDPPL